MRLTPVLLSSPPSPTAVREAVKGEGALAVVAVPLIMVVVADFLYVGVTGSCASSRHASIAAISCV